MQFTKKVMSRKYVVKSLITIILIGLFISLVILRFIRLTDFPLLYIGNGFILYMLLCIFLYVPLIVPMKQITKVDDQALYILPENSNSKKMRIALDALFKNTVEQYYRQIAFASISKITFTFDAHFGAYAYQRFSYVLIIHLESESIKIFLNPQQNGILLPSGNGLPFVGTHAKSEIINLIEHLNKKNCKLEDPYQLLEAMKNEHIVMYDYLLAKHKNVIY